MRRRARNCWRSSGGGGGGGVDGGDGGLSALCVCRGFCCPLPSPPSAFQTF